jgi:hypothetical protein
MLPRFSWNKAKFIGAFFAERAQVAVEHEQVLRGKGNYKLKLFFHIGEPTATAKFGSSRPMR